MTLPLLEVLSGDSVDKLRVMTKSKELDITKTTFDELVSKVGLQTLKTHVRFDPSIELDLPDGVSQAANKDLVNAKKMFLFLPDLTAIDATDERVWVTLALRDFSEYAIERWPRAPKVEHYQHIQNHWFATNSRGRIRDHAISRLWWSYNAAKSMDEEGAEDVLEALFSDSEFVASLLGRPSSSSNSNVAGCVIALAKEFGKKGVPYKRENHRDFMKKVNLLAGRIYLSALTAEQIKAQLQPLYEEAYGLS